jgi:hypothetical protein
MNEPSDSTRGARGPGAENKSVDAAKREAPVRLRRLPFNGPEGKPAYVLADGPDGFLSRIADGIEEDQLNTGREVLKLSRAMLDSGEQLTADEMAYVARRLTECLRDVLAIADSRGARLPEGPQQRAADRP